MEDNPEYKYLNTQSVDIKFRSGEFLHKMTITFKNKMWNSFSNSHLNVKSTKCTPIIWFTPMISDIICEFFDSFAPKHLNPDING